MVYTIPCDQATTAVPSLTEYNVQWQKWPPQLIKLTQNWIFTKKNIMMVYTHADHGKLPEMVLLLAPVMEKVSAHIYWF